MDESLLPDLFSANLVKHGDLVTIQIPGETTGEIMRGVGSIVEGGSIFYAGKTFNDLPSFYACVKKTNVNETDAKNSIEQREDEQTPKQDVIRHTLIEGTPLVSLSEKLLHKNVMKEPQSHFLTLDPSMGEEEISLQDPSMDPYNDLDSLPSEDSLPKEEDSCDAPSVEGLKKQNQFHPPQQLISAEFSSMNSIVSPKASISPENSEIEELEGKRLASSVEVELDDLLEEPELISQQKDEIQIYPQTAEMLSLNMGLDSFSRIDSEEIRAVYSKQNQTNQTNKIPSTWYKKSVPESPTKRILLKNAAKQKMKEIQLQNQQGEERKKQMKRDKQRLSGSKSPERKGKKRGRSPVSPIFSPPSKFRKTGDTTRKRLFSESKEGPKSIEIISLESSVSLDDLASDGGQLKISLSPSPPQPLDGDPEDLNTSIDEEKQKTPRTAFKPLPVPVPSTPTYVPLSEGVKEKTITIMASSLSNSMSEKIQRLAQRIGGEFVREFTPDVTHLVISCDEGGIPKTTIKLYQAMVSGCWIMNYTWVLESFRKSSWSSEVDHVAKGHVGIIQGRKKKLQNRPRLFSSLRFYLLGEFTAPSKEECKSLIKIGGGTILSSLPTIPKTEHQMAEQESNTYILAPVSFSVKYAEDIYFKCGLHPLASHYLLDCISQFELLETKLYHFLPDCSGDDGDDYDDKSVPMSLAF